MRTKLPEAKSIDLKSIEWALECAALLGWNDLLRYSKPELVHLRYETGAQGTLDYLTLWSSAKRGEWDLVCEYWMKADQWHQAGLNFSNGHASAVLGRVLPSIMQHQEMFTPASGAHAGLIQVNIPTLDGLVSAKKTMAAAMERTGDLPLVSDFAHLAPVPHDIGDA
jgi:hypothetical protein